MNDLLTQDIKSHFETELPSDKVLSNNSRQVVDACFSYVKPKKPSNPQLVHLSIALLKDLNISIIDKDKFTQIVSGALPFKDYNSHAMCYGGHQFGHWAGQLGDGRAINIAELDLQGQNWKFQLKGAGPTPYSRRSDGLAVLRSSIREYLCSEAMHHLGVPTTRALSLVKTGDWVTRDILYSGDPKEEHGAIVCRVSPSFIRFGSFEIFASRRDVKNLKILLDYTIKHHFPHIGAPSKESYLHFFKEVASKTKEMIIHWQRVGFVHGVMNTDNMSILGLTIDYGPYGWLEDFNPLWTPNTTDAQNKRYRFGNQSSVALWNLTQLANAIYPLIDEVAPLEEILKAFKSDYLKAYKIMMAHKLGIYDIGNIDDIFIKNLETYLADSQIDYTIFFRLLSKGFKGEFEGFWQIIEKTSYLSKNEVETFMPQWMEWFMRFSNYVKMENMDAKKRAQKMNAINPKYVLRNYMAQLAIDDAEKGNFALVDELYNLLLKPYDEQPANEKWFAKRPEWARHKVGCSMLSCSS